MKVLEPGHRYELMQLDATDADPLIVQFVMRRGPMYPGNQSTHPGTICQEALRAVIDRVKYVNGQIADDRNVAIIEHLRAAIRLFEERAAERHGVTLDIENLRTCSQCGHIACNHEQEA